MSHGKNRWPSHQQSPPLCCSPSPLPQQTPETPLPSPCEQTSPCTQGRKSPWIHKRKKRVFCFSRSLQSKGQPAFKLDCKHWWFPWLPKNTYQQLPVTEGQIPVSSTNSVLLLLCPLKNREEEKIKEKKKEKRENLFPIDAVPRSFSSH